MNMDFWVIIGLFAGAIGGILIIGLVGKLTGTTEILTAIGSLMTFIWNVIKLPVEFVFNNIPKPIRIILMIVLVSIMGLFIYRYTFGLTHVCGEDGVSVYKSDPFAGFAYQNLPTEDALKNAPGIEFNNNDVTIQCGSSLNFINTCSIDKGDLSGGTQNFVTKGSDETSDGYTQDVIYGISPKSTVEDMDGAVQILARGATKNGGQCSKRFFSTQDTASYICLNVPDGKCSLVPVGTDLRVTRQSCVVFGFADSEKDARVIGLLIYELDDMNRLTAQFKDESGGIGPWAGSISDCKIQDNVEDESFNFKMTYSKKILGFDGGSVSYDVPLYNAGLAPLVTYSGGFCINVENLDRKKLLGEMELQVPSSTDVFRFVCNKDTVDKYDTNLTVFGINPFDSAFIIFLVVLMAGVSLMKFIKGY
jgi:hypothetical protein